MRNSRSSSNTDAPVRRADVNASVAYLNSERGACTSIHTATHTDTPRHTRHARSDTVRDRTIHLAWFTRVYGTTGSTSARAHTREKRTRFGTPPTRAARAASCASAVETHQARGSTALLHWEARPATAGSCTAPACCSSSSRSGCALAPEPCCVHRTAAGRMTHHAVGTTPHHASKRHAARHLRTPQANKRRT
jgi:hypothetical protein